MPVGRFMSIQFKKNREIHPFLYDTLEQARISIRAAIAWFTDPELFKLLMYKKNKGVEITVILNNDVINRTLTDLGMLEDCIRFSNILLKDYIMHHKFCIIDNKKVLTGSYNWTVRARRHNNENLLCIEIPNIVSEYQKEFDSLTKNSQGQSRIPTLQQRDAIQNVEDLAILRLEEQYNFGIMDRLNKIKDLNSGIRIDILYGLIGNHTPVIAAKKLAESDVYIQEGLQKLVLKKRLDLSFEESIIRKEYANLFDSRTKENAKKKLEQLEFFKDPIYQTFWDRYI